MGSGLRRLWFDVIRTAFLLVFRLSAAHLRTVTLDAYALSVHLGLLPVGAVTACVAFEPHVY